MKLSFPAKKRVAGALIAGGLFTTCGGFVPFTNVRIEEEVFWKSQTAEVQEWRRVKSDLSDITNRQYREHISGAELVYNTDLLQEYSKLNEKYVQLNAQYQKLEASPAIQKAKEEYNKSFNWMEILAGFMTIGGVVIAMGAYAAYIMVRFNENYTSTNNKRKQTSNLRLVG